MKFDLGILAGLLIPFLGTSLGAACVLLLRGELRRNVQRGLTGLCRRRDDGGFHLEPADPRH